MLCGSFLWRSHRSNEGIDEFFCRSVNRTEQREMTHSSVGQSTIQKFLAQPVFDGLIVGDDSELPGEIKIIGIGPKGVEKINEEGIYTYYQLVSRMFQRNWILDKCMDYLKKVGLAPSYCRTVLIITWNHFHIGERLQEGTDTPLRGHAFRNGKLVAEQTENPDQVYIPHMKKEHIKILNANDITTYYELMGQLFYCRWDRAMFQKFIRDNKLPPELGRIIYDKAYADINLSMLTGRD